MMGIPEMSKKLEELNSFFSDSKSMFIENISLHESRFKQEDVEEFQDLINQIKEDARVKIEEFMTRKLEDKSVPYEKEISKYTQES